jgi:hypothetical protein
MTETVKDRPTTFHNAGQNGLNTQIGRPEPNLLSVDVAA